MPNTKLWREVQLLVLYKIVAFCFYIRVLGSICTIPKVCVNISANLIFNSVMIDCLLYSVKLILQNIIDIITLKNWLFFFCLGRMRFWWNIHIININSLVGIKIFYNELDLQDNFSFTTWYCNYLCSTEDWPYYSVMIIYSNLSYSDLNILKL